MAVDLTLLELYAPQFANDDRAEDMLTAAYRSHTQAQWGVSYEDAMAFYTAHMLTQLGPVGAGAGTGGAVIAETTGDLSVTYANAMASVDEADLNGTRYGRMYLRLLRMQGSTGPLLITPG